MPELLREIQIYGSSDGLILRPSGVKDGETPSICMSYETNSITSISSREHHAKDASLLQIYGVVGLLNLVATSHLICITQREQVAQIRGKAIYAVRDVQLIPLSSQDDAEKAIVAAQKRLKQSGKVEHDDETDVEGTDAEDDAESASVKEDQVPEAIASESNPTPESKDSSTVSELEHRKGQFGRFATKWFKKGTKKSNVNSPQVSSNEEISSSDQPTEVDETTRTIVADSEGGENVRKDSREDGTLTQEAQETKQKSNIEVLSNRILRNARVYFSATGFYFSYDHDLSGTLTQKSDQVSSFPLWRRFDSLYFWNRHLISSFIDAGRGNFVLPLMQGFVGQRAFSISKTDESENDLVSGAAENPSDVLAAQSEDSNTTELGVPDTVEETPKTQTHDFLLTLISRRSTKRAGLRYLRRGVDDDGNVANYVETEQILSTQSWDIKDKVFSLVQLRGSIPLHFSQSPYSFKPTPVMFSSESTNHAAFNKHFASITKRYGGVQIVSLIDRHGPEVSIGDAYENHAKQLDSEGGVNGRKVKFEWFDFHTACKGMRFENVSILMESIHSTLESYGWITKQDDRNTRLQTGIVRTNCMDCLDRSNVVQSAIATWALQQQLKDLGLDMDLKTDPTTQWFNTLWADNGDAMSRQYAGTAALKGDFTRYRKRNWTGALSDFSRTLNRYYNNIFGDYFLQTCIDYYLGNAGPEIFDEFETDMMSKDYALNMVQIRSNAIDTCKKIVVEDPKERLVAGWTLSCPRESNTLRTFPFEECVLLLSDAALYFCRFDWNTEKVSGFERVDLIDVVEIYRGAYITSGLGAAHLDETKNVGFVVRYRKTEKTIIRRNTRSLQNNEESEELSASDSKNKGKVASEDDSKDQKQENENQSQDDIRILAFKSLPPETSAATSGIKDIAHMSETELVAHVCDEIRKSIEGIIKRQSGVHSAEAITTQVGEKDVISVADARKNTGYMESIGYSLKRLVWS